MPMRRSDVVWVPPAQADLPPSTREWLARAHAHLGHLLPEYDPSVLLTEDLIDPSGAPVDVMRHFGRTGQRLRTLRDNWHGIAHSAQAIGGGEAVDEPAPPWPGFEELWIPIRDGLALYGRLGLAEDGGRVLRADCIVILPGLFGDLSILRTRDLAMALRSAGFHALALDGRAHGRTEARYPDIYCNFGVLETIDLLHVSEWLERQPFVRRTGLVGFCWGANLGLLAAWYDGRPERHRSITEALAARLPEVSPRRHFRAGVLAFASVLHFEELADQLEKPRAYLMDPILATMQETIRRRAGRKHHPERTHSLRKLIEFEFARSELDYPDAVRDGYHFLRFKPYRGEPAGAKLAEARIPVLIVHAVNDPLCPAQDVADLMAGVDNSNVAAMILAGGGHVGFAPYARAYYFSLILNFFDPLCGAAAAGTPGKPGDAWTAAAPAARID